MFTWLRNEESGQGMVEYGLIVALIAIVAAVGFQSLGKSTKAQVENAANVIKNPAGTIDETVAP